MTKKKKKKKTPQGSGIQNKIHRQQMIYYQLTVKSSR